MKGRGERMNGGRRIFQYSNTIVECLNAYDVSMVFNHESLGVPVYIN